jgi:hypothetical protein
LAEGLAEDVFQESGLSNLFHNWISSGWIDLPSDDKNSDDERDPIYVHLIDDARASTLDAMRPLYENDTGIVEHDLILRGLRRTFECRKELHKTVMTD